MNKLLKNEIVMNNGRNVEVLTYSANYEGTRAV